MTSYFAFLDQIVACQGRRITIHKIEKLGISRDVLFAYLLAPGFTRSFHAKALGISRSTVARYISLASKAAAADPDMAKRAMGLSAAITASDGLRMTERRRRSHLSHWARLAISDYYHQGQNFAELGRLFNCSRSTARRAVRSSVYSFDPLSGERRLSCSQRAPGPYAPL